MKDGSGIKATPETSDVNANQPQLQPRTCLAPQASNGLAGQRDQHARDQHAPS